MNELQGEKIDILEWNSDTNKYIQNALSPSQVLRVDVNAENGNAVAVVPDRHLSLAIGKEGHNARLAAKLCGLKIDIKSDMDVDLEALQRQEELESENKENTAVDVAEQESVHDARPDEVENVAEQADSTKSEEIITTEPAVDEDAILAAMIAEEENEIATLGLSPEEELMLFEEEEIVEEDGGEASGSEIADLPEDLWSIHRAGLNQEQAGVIRFAEDDRTVSYISIEEKTVKKLAKIKLIVTTKVKHM